MTSRPGGRGSRSKVARRLLALGFTVAVGYTSGVLALGGCAGAPWPSNGQLPERVVDKLTECGKKGPKPLETVNYDLTFTVHVTEDDVEARVDDVMLMDSTLHLEEVEVCMAEALHGMRTPLSALALRRRTPALDPTVAPESRAMLGQAQVALLLEAGAAIIVGFAVYTVIVHVILDKHRTKAHAHPAQPTTVAPPAPVPVLSAATAEPTATTVPITTAVPLARRYPNQTCSDDELDHLQREKDKVCTSGYAADCRLNRSEKMRGRIACSAIVLTIRQRLSCLGQRKQIQEKCFGGVPDPGHKKAIEQEQDGINNCEALKLVNCAKGHPMAGK